MTGDELVRPAMTAREAADLHLLLERFLEEPAIEQALGEDRADNLRRARRSLHGVLRGAGYVVDSEGWRLADATVRTLLGSRR